MANFKHTAFYTSVLHDNIESLWISILLFRLTKALKIWCAKWNVIVFTIPNSRSMQHMGPVPYSVPEMEYFALMFASTDYSLAKLIWLGLEKIKGNLILSAPSTE